MTSPMRLIEDPNVAPSLQVDLRRCAQDENYDAIAGLARFQALLATTHAPPADATQGMSRSHLSWLGVGVGAIAAVIALWLTTRAVFTDEQAAAPALPQTQPTPSPSLAPSTPATPPPAQALDTALDPSTPAADQTAPAPEIHRTATASPSPPKPSLRRELDLMAKARRLIDADPVQAHRITQQLAREFPEGVLREEREGLSVIALWNMGQHTAAQAQARSFLTRYPKSAMRARLQSIDDGTLK